MAASTRAACRRSAAVSAEGHCPTSRRPWAVTELMPIGNRRVYAGKPLMRRSVCLEAETRQDGLEIGVVHFDGLRAENLRRLGAW